MSAVEKIGEPLRDAATDPRPGDNTSSWQDQPKAAPARKASRTTK